MPHLSEISPGPLESHLHHQPSGAALWRRETEDQGHPPLSPARLGAKAGLRCQYYCLLPVERGEDDPGHSVGVEGAQT